MLWPLQLLNIHLYTVSTSTFLQKFPAVFIDKIEKLKDYQLEPNIHSTVQPVVQKSHPTPLHYHAKVEAKLKQLEG